MKKIILSIAILIGFSAAIKAQNVNIPDANFKAFLVGDATINTNSDTEIQVSEASAYNGTINCSSQNISDLTGIETFVNLTELDCGNNSLTSLNLSANTALTVLSCYTNSLYSLDVSANNALSILYCFNNTIGDLNINACTALTHLYCGGNSLTNLDIATNTALIELTCDNNSLTNLNVSANTALTSLSCNRNSIGSLNVTTNTALNTLNCNNNSLNSLNIATNTALTNLDCSYNSLSNLDASTNSSLIGIDCSMNSINSLNITSCTALIYLYCAQNSIPGLDISAVTALLSLDCSYNSLISLNVANGNNTNLTYFVANANPNLTCIQVDDVAYSQTNWTYIDATASFSTNCGASVDNNIINNLNIYPNPTKNTLNIDTSNSFTTIKLFDISGKMLKTFNPENRSLNVADLKAGIYFLKLIDATKQINLTRIIQKL